MLIERYPSENLKSTQYDTMFATARVSATTDALYNQTCQINYSTAQLLVK